MTYIFSGTPEDMMAAVLKDLEKSAEGGPSADAYFDRALVSLVGLYDRQAQAGPADPERLKRFRLESSRALAGFGRKVTAYVTETAIIAETANDDEWYELCMRRSAIQSLLDDYADTPVAALVDLSEVADLDAELRAVGEQHGPVPEPFVPRGLPDSHWWWRYPRTTEGG